MHVDRDQPMRVGHARRRDRQRRQQAAVDQFAAVHDMRREQARDRERGAQRLPQWPLSQPHLALPDQVDRDRGELDRQCFDHRIADHLAHGIDQTRAAQQAGSTDDRIDQAQEIGAIHALQRLAEVAELACREHAADQRAARGTGDRDDVETARIQRLDHADLRQAARTAGAERERDLFPACDLRRFCRRHRP